MYAKHCCNINYVYLKMVFKHAVWTVSVDAISVWIDTEVAPVDSHMQEA